jgi:hypothetical protein
MRLKGTWPARATKRQEGVTDPVQCEKNASERLEFTFPFGPPRVSGSLLPFGLMCGCLAQPRGCPSPWGFARTIRV